VAAGELQKQKRTSGKKVVIEGVKMDRTVKTWGEKWNLFQNDLCEVSYLCLKPHQRCSWHKHQTTFNLFFVISGELYIKMEDDVATVEKYQFFTTKPGEFHEFQTHDQLTKIIEIMFVTYDAEDIERESLGGPLDG
jgi:quercetin dioxygenase-like cupin family protein